MASYWHFKYTPITSVFEAPHDLAPAFFLTSSPTTFPCLLCSTYKLVTLLFLEQPHLFLPLPGMFFSQIHIRLASSSWIETQEHFCLNITSLKRTLWTPKLKELSLTAIILSLLTLFYFSSWHLSLPDIIYVFIIFSHYRHYKPQKGRSLEQYQVHILGAGRRMNYSWHGELV